jgi:hypothetical protein
MATVTLIANTNYSALTLANDDTIDCAGFVLTLNIQPTHTGIQVTSPGTAGTVVFSGAWLLPTWDFFAGANGFGGMIGTLPTGATIKSITGGSASNGTGIATNNGTVTTAIGGSGTSANGIVTNNGTVTTARGGAVTSGAGVSTNNGTVTLAIGGTTASSTGIATNNGTVTTANGGTFGSGLGVGTNNGTVTLALGGSGGVANHGVSTNNGLCLRLTDGTGRGVSIWRGSQCFVEGPYIAGVIPTNIKTIYSLGALSGSATIAGDATVVTLSEGGGSRPSNPFLQQVIG